MPTKTISLDLEAYQRLSRARRSSRESFSQVVKRAMWAEPKRTGGALMEAWGKWPDVSDDELERLEQGQKADCPPESKWKRR